MQNMRVLSALVVAGCLSTAAQAASRAFVSGKGVDQVNCGSEISPCRTFQYAHDNVVSSGGEIDVLDPAGYGPITITKAISIFNDGVGTASILAAAQGNAITVNAGPSDAIILRGLTLDGLSVATNGVEFNSGLSLGVRDSTIINFINAGINFVPSGDGPATLGIAGLFTALNGATQVEIKPSGTRSTTASIVHSTVSGSPTASSNINVDGSNNSHAFVHLAVDDSIIRNIPATAVVAKSVGSNVSVSLFRSVVAHAFQGLDADGPDAQINLDLSMLSYLTTVAVSTNGAKIRTFGNNGIVNYQTLGTTLTLLMLQ
jgi:hypothetical protein